MSEKPSPKPSASKPSAKAAASATPSGAKGGAAKPMPDETFEFLAPAQGTGELGRLAHYRVLKVLGRGGMGTVFMAEDTRLHRVVALKVMLPSIARKAISRDRFLREARATAAIEHDHIVTIYEVNQDNDVPYLAMQFLKGMSLEDWLKAGKTLNIPQVMRIGKEIAKALAAAHACQLIHRDIKPSNIWLDAVNKGRVKILDFGLARPTNEETHLTQEGMILGTPAYMSPEQARGSDIDERCDLFSLGCVIYRLCAGTLPFTGKDTMSMLLAITSAEPGSLQEQNPEVPTALAELTHRLLAKNPADRPPSAKGVVQALQDIERDWIANGHTASARPLVNTRTVSGKPDATMTTDPALEESAITEMELQQTPTTGTTAPPSRSSRTWLYAGLGGALIAVVMTVCCLGFIVSQDQGYIQIILDDDARMLWPDGPLTVWDHHNKPHLLAIGTHRLPAGGYHIKPDELPKGVQIEPNLFSLHRGQTLEIKIRFAPPGKAPSPAIEPLTLVNAKRLQLEWSTYLNREIVENNTIGIKLVLIPAGEFFMGSTSEVIKQPFLGKKFERAEKSWSIEKYKLHAATEGPIHRVRLTKPYYLGMHEVTIGQFSQFVAAMNFKTEAEKSGTGGTGLEIGSGIVRKAEFRWNNLGQVQTKEHPVGNVTWADAEAFCAWLTKKDKKHYRLPTEAEWEYACRAGTSSLWHFGDDPRTANDFMWYFQSPKGIIAGAGARLTGQKRANEFGLHDMHGNIEEMCADYWAPYNEKLPRDDPKGPAFDPGKGRISRGGSFLDVPQIGRSAFRNAHEPNLANIQIGFRVVCEVPMPAE